MVLEYADIRSPIETPLTITENTMVRCEDKRIPPSDLRVLFRDRGDYRSVAGTYHPCAEANSQVRCPMAAIGLQ